MYCQKESQNNYLQLGKVEGSEKENEKSILNYTCRNKN